MRTHDENEVNDKQQPPKPEGGNHNRRGFYIALAVCLAALGVAGWTALHNVTDYEDKTGSSLQQVDNQPFSMPAYSLPSLPLSSAAPVSSQTPSSRAVSSHRPTRTASKAKPAAAQVSKLALPIAGAPTLQPYSESPVYSKTMQDWRAHTGLDFAADKGTAVVAAGAGTVLAVREDGAWGKMVTVQHSPTLVSLYCGLEESKVQKGQSVSAGENLGTVGTVPCEAADPSHLHFAVQVSGKFVDPALALAGKLP